MVPRRQSRGCRRPADLRRPRHRRELRACLDRHVPVRRQPARAGRRAVRRATGELDLHGRQGSPVQGSLMPIDDPTEVQAQYAQEDNLRARQALWQGATGTDPKEVLWRTIEEWQPKRLLEVGGGQGELADRIASELGAEVVFLDLSPRMVELARARGVDARLGDAQDLPFPDDAFDTVVAAWMLYHVPDVDRALAEFARVLVPGGALIAVTNAANHIAELRELLKHRDSWAHTFSRENGERFLQPHFASVERYDADVEVSVESRETLVAYRDSVAVPTSEVHDDIPLPFVVHGRTSIFFATT